MNISLSDILIDERGFFFQVISIEEDSVTIRPIERVRIEYGTNRYRPCPYRFNNEYLYWDHEDNAIGRSFPVIDGSVEIDGKQAKILQYF